MSDTPAQTPEVPPGFHKLNGANVICVRSDGAVLCIESKRTDRPPWEIPGGGKDRGEIAPHAATSEAQEEAGLIINEEDLIPFAFLLQRIPRINAEGHLFLFVCYKFDASRLLLVSDETKGVEWIPFNDLVEKLRDPAFFSLGYRRMLAIYVTAELLCQDIEDLPARSVKFGRLSDPVIVPASPPFVV